MANRYKAFTFAPANGGRLMTRLSPDEVPPSDYTIKSDWRRDLDVEMRREGVLKFRPNKEIEQGEQHLPQGVDGDPIMLIGEIRQSNGKVTVVAGTRTRLFRYFGLETGGYYSVDPADYPVGQIPAYHTPNISPDNPPYTPYFDDNPGVWIEIGSGFSELGHRWELENLNGYGIFNNGVDIPVTYRPEEFEVKPIYELREQGIGSIGTIAVFQGRLYGADITELNDASSILDLIDSGATTAGQAGAIWSGLITGSLYDGITVGDVGNTVVATANIFANNMVGKRIRFSTGKTRRITAYTSETQVTVDGVPSVETAKPFFITQLVVYSSGITATQVGLVVTASAAIFELGMIGAALRWDDETFYIIDGFTDATHVTVATAASKTAQGFKIVPIQFQVASNVPGFWTSDMRGLRILFDDGTVRTITDVEATNGSIVLVNSDMAVTVQQFSIENPSAFAPLSNSVATTRTIWRMIRSEFAEPRRWAVVVTGSITAGSRLITLTQPTKSFAVGDEINILGAGPNGGSLIANIIFIAGAGTVIYIDIPAETTATAASIQRLDSLGSGVGFVDLQDDGSGIIRMMPLRGQQLVVYKDTSIFIGATAPDPVDFLQFRGPLKTSKSIYYPWTLVEVNQLYHMYAGRSAFYRFDGTSEVPEESSIAELCKDVFFNLADIAQSDYIFVAASSLTNEIFWFFLGDYEDQALVFDYLQNTMSTSPRYYSAAATVKRPKAGVEVINEDWFVLGTTDGRMLQYGLVNGPLRSSGAVTLSQAVDEVTASSDFFVREDIGKSIQFADETIVTILDYTDASHVTVDFVQVKVAQTGTILPSVWTLDGEDYASVLQGGLSPWGSKYNEKLIRAYVLHLAGQSPDTEVEFEIKGCRNPSETVEILGTKTILSPETLVRMFYRQNFLQDKLTIEGQRNPCRLVSRTFDLMGGTDRAFTRRADEA